LFYSEGNAMNFTEFTKAVKSTKMRQRTIDAVRMVLVDGKKIVEAAALADMKPQQLHEAVARIEVAHLALKGVPGDWHCVTVTVPKECVEAVREIERQAKRDAGLSVD
jgi:transposase-like protein